MVGRVDELGAELIARRLAARLFLVPLYAACVAACGGDPGRTSAATSAAASTDPMDSLVVERTLGTVDSAMTRREALRRVSEKIPAPAALAAGAADRDALVAQVGAALAAQDTAALVKLSLTPAEWMHLYYPTASARSLPRTVGPRMGWYLVATNSSRGLQRLLESARQERWTVVSARCLRDDWKEGANQLSAPCVLRVARAARRDTVDVAYAYQLITRDGMTKIVAYSRDADPPPPGRSAASGATGSNDK